MMIPATRSYRTCRTSVAGLAVLALAACAGSSTTPGAPSPEEPALAYRMPAGEPFVYEMGDTSTLRMEMAGMGNVDVTIQARTTAELDFSPQGDGVQVVIRVTDVNGLFANSMGPTITVDNQHRPGPATVAVAGTGVVDIVDAPVFSEVLSQIATPEGLYRSFFIPLPGTDAMRGAAWTDTVRIDEAPQGLSAQTVSIVRSRWERDTVVAGRTLAVIVSDLENTVDLAGTTQGVEIRQRLQGTARRVSLWDPVAAVLVERIEDGQASGTTDLPAMNITGIPVSAESHSTLRLRR
jgi:hypothetical protein